MDIVCVAAGAQHIMNENQALNLGATYKHNITMIQCVVQILETVPNSLHALLYILTKTFTGIIQFQLRLYK